MFHHLFYSTRLLQFGVDDDCHMAVDASVETMPDCVKENMDSSRDTKCLEKQSGGMGTATIVMIVLAVIAVICVIGLAVWYFVWKRKKHSAAKKQSTRPTSVMVSKPISHKSIVKGGH
jgi:uncharacterized protein HemX